MKILDTWLPPLVIFGPLFIVIGLTDVETTLIGQLMGILGAFMLGLGAVRIHGLLAAQSQGDRGVARAFGSGPPWSGTSPLAAKPDDAR